MSQALTTETTEPSVPKAQDSEDTGYRYYLSASQVFGGDDMPKTTTVIVDGVRSYAKNKLNKDYYVWLLVIDRKTSSISVIYVDDKPETYIEQNITRETRFIEGLYYAGETMEEDTQP